MTNLLSSLLFVDLETSGLIPGHHSILSIGAVSLPTGREFYGECQSLYGRHIDPQALLINGFDMKDITSSDKKPTVELLHDFDEWSKSLWVLSDHNTWFDAGFLEKDFKHFGIPWRFGYRYIDLHSVYYSELLRRGNLAPTNYQFSLDFILASVGLPVRKGVHNALEDAKLEAEAYSRLVFNKPCLREYSSLPIPELLIE